ncbi:hypothetical protein DPEC_G00351220 [Dallia pectoralis]|uniref:Uncharacterized protein n=1 Tax=Dallia pectoralis TaxID=75939 RepID=A0ACC2F1V2_DALPE|nr:hypothetical protein DPEC_G00351220 [Dallia pectoralis]
MWFIIWTALLLTEGLCKGRGKSNADGHSITFNPAEITVQTGLCAVISCTFIYPNDAEPKTALWNKCQQGNKCDLLILHTGIPSKVQDDYSQRVSLLETDLSKKNCSVIINNINENDTGEYQFRSEMSLKGGYTYKEKVKITVTGLTQKPSILTPALKEGEPVTLTCTAPGFCSGSPPNITWRWRKTTADNITEFPGNTTIQINKDLDSVRTTHLSTLTFTPSAEHHGTDVTCQVTFSEKIKIEETVTLNVTFLNRSECVVQAEVMTCVCICQEEPIPLINWPILKNITVYNHTTVVSGSLVTSNINLPVRNQTSNPVMCVCQMERDNKFEEILALLRDPKLITAFVIGTAFSASICSIFLCSMGKCKRHKEKIKKDCEHPGLNLEIVTSANQLTDPEAVVGGDLTPLREEPKENAENGGNQTHGLVDQSSSGQKPGSVDVNYATNNHSEPLLRCPVLNTILNRTVSRMPSWALFLALLNVGFCSNSKPFKITETHSTKKEGSCITIHCTVESNWYNKEEEQWFWMKNAQWNQTNGNFTGTIIVSSNPAVHTQDPDVAHRAEYIGSALFFTTRNGPSCSLVINNLQKTDSGIYKFRYKGEGTNKWMTEPGLNLTVEDEPCQVNIDNQPVLKEFNNVSIKCSTTSSSCKSVPEITGLGQTIQTPYTVNYNKTSTQVSFNASWLDDGRVLSCQPRGNQDKCMVRNIKLTVGYAPKMTMARVSSSNIKKGDNVILTCSSKGNPNATYSWYKDLKEKSDGAKYDIRSVQPSDSGIYHCEAFNLHGTMKSNEVTLDVKYSPTRVTIVRDDPTSQDKEGNRLKFTCVLESNPPVYTYSWYKDGQKLRGEESTCVLDSIKPEDSGEYYCGGTNDVGNGQSSKYRLEVRYVPRNTLISPHGHSEVKLGRRFSLTCEAQAPPDRRVYTWYYSSSERSPSKQLLHTGVTTEWETVTLDNHGCYTCSVTNDMGTGSKSMPSCIEVLYGPTEPVFFMVHSAQEGHLVIVNCTAQSRPDSTLTLSSSPRSVSSPSNQVTGCSRPSANVLWCTFNVTLLHEGVYTCRAENSEGTSSAERHLEVRYSPKDVRALVQPDPVVNENTSLSFICTAHSNPQVSKFTWVTIVEGEPRVLGHYQNFTVTSITRSHSGPYGCVAQNSLGTSKSQTVDVKVKHAPNYAEITHNMTSTWQREGSNPVTLSCLSHCYPQVDYEWFTSTEAGDTSLGKVQNITILPDMPGTYYCVSRNKLGSKESKRIKLFLNRVFFRVLLGVSIFFFLVLVPIFIFLLYRYKKNNLIRQGTSSKLLCCAHFGFLGWLNGTNENLVEEPRASSRDELRPGTPYRAEPLPQTSASTSDCSTVYCLVKTPDGIQGNTKEAHTRNRQNETAIYAMRQFKGQETSRLGTTEVKESDVYAKIAKPKLKKQNNTQGDYENFKGVRAPVPNVKTDTETETSEDDMEIHYSEVKFTKKPGQQNLYGSHHQKACHGDSSSDEDDYKVHYSDVKI